MYTQFPVHGKAQKAGADEQRLFNDKISTS